MSRWNLGFSLLSDLKIEYVLREAIKLDKNSKVGPLSIVQFQSHLLPWSKYPVFTHACSRLTTFRVSQKEEVKSPSSKWSIFSDILYLNNIHLFSSSYAA